ncbi:MAG: MBL fold metallo-hydrolase [SAR202 cluster bacterium]|nr:MBL fold metallo-hydrolase [SAR202 cluster bacterium]
MEIAPGIHTVPGIRWSRTYLIEDDTMALVDSGLPWDAGSVVRYIRSIGRNPDDLGYILATHSHPDHTSGALSIQRRTGARIVAHSGDTRTYSDDGVSLSYMKVFNSLPVPLPFFKRTPVDLVVEDGHVLPLRGGTRVVHVPGHTPGSLCFLVEDGGVLFSGDTLFSDGRRLSRSVPFPGYDGEKYRRSLERLATLEFETLCGGHGVPLMGGASQALRELLASRPEPPTWRGFLASIPRRLYNSKSLSGED